MYYRASGLAVAHYQICQNSEIAVEEATPLYGGIALADYGKIMRTQLCLLYILLVNKNSLFLQNQGTVGY
jgi:hypothetical protein